jgi:predicted transcriptional regulator
MGALSVRLPDSLHEKVRDLADQEGISMNQLVMLAVSEKVTRLDAEAQFAHLDALERFGEAVAGEEGLDPEELMGNLLDRAAGEEPKPGDEKPGDGKPGDERPGNERPARAQ